MQFWAIIIDSVRESLDRKIFWVLVILTLMVGLAMLSVGFEGDQVHFCFGIWTMESAFYNPLSDLGPSRLAGAVVYGLLAGILGSIGMVLMIVATAGVFPSLMAGGSIDSLLSKPIGRPRLFAYKYLATMVFVLLQATIFVGVTFLVMGLRWGVWRPGYLLSVPLVVLLFSYIYCVSVLVAVKTRSTVAAILVSIGAWVFFAMIHNLPLVFDEFPLLKEHRLIYNTVRIVHWIPPKTGDFVYLAARLAGTGPSVDAFPPFMVQRGWPQDQASFQLAREIEERELLKDPVASIGSSLLFELVVVAWAMWIFVRRDY
ncbi:MAG: ABC transporter permease subunit [Planctomycetes bacterium]|nr:ABC transporter permease subunit [Planctomycetota bacterium]